jgi:hypothetical protein
MNKLLEFLLPRGRKEQMPATEQISQFRPVVWITSEVCYAGIPGALDGMQGGAETVRCGCVRCEPDLWCRWRDAEGRACTKQASYPVKPEAPKWCQEHYREVVRAERANGSGGNGTTGVPGQLRALFGKLARGAK